ncbi:MAG: flagellar biosynthesis protein FliQ [Actinomycetota bacterium]|jgi:flagellar biosynthetic protein FliQ|nr:flagellar biosynthesis protein FliQ [Actinomycetota bacterium]MDI7251170.1 flagellar biosynthesis protein FliQ [Actinomycetota bacterium]
MLEIVGRAFFLALMMLLPLLGVTMLVGVIISILQAATQIQEMTLTFIPKLFVTLLMIILAGPWIIRTLVNFTLEIFRSLPEFIR